MFARDPACGAALSVAETATATARTLVLNACSDGDYAWEPEDGDASVLVKAFEHAWGEALKRGEAIRIDGNAPALLRDQIRRLWGKEHPQTPWLSPADGVFELRSANQPKASPPDRETLHAQTIDDDETEWAIADAEKSIAAYKAYARRKPPGKYHADALRRIGEIAANDASREQEAKAKRDQILRKQAQASDDLSGWQEALKGAETEAFRSEAHNKIAWFEQETAKLKDEKVGEQPDEVKEEPAKPPGKKPSPLGKIMGVVVLCGAGIAFFSSGENPIPPAPTPASTETQTEPIRTQPGLATKQQAQAAPAQATRASAGPAIAMVRIPAGPFTMGSPAGETDRRTAEGPQRTVHIRAFEMGKYEVTQGQWKAVMGGENPSRFSQCGDDCPVENVSWNMVQDFLKKLNTQTGSNYRLPSEAEWEYAARAGTTGPFSFTGPITAAKANYDANYQYDGSPKGDHRSKTVRVGSLPANPWGLHEVHGNVWEWVQDCLHDSYRDGAPGDGQAWETNCSGKARVLRGGSWNSVPRNLRSANRSWGTPDVRDFTAGFRLARTLP